MLENVKDKSFLSFTFNGHAIEEFGCAVVSNDDRYATFLQPQFSNTITTVPGRIGSLYWGTDITGIQRTINIATDCATARQIANLKKTFAPGIYGKISFAETEYRYGYALVDSATSFSFLPFDETTTINGKEYKTGIYKGTGSIILFYPDPYEYGEAQYQYADDYTDKYWMLESGLPFKNTITEKNCFLANNQKLNAEDANRILYAYNAGNADARSNFCFQKTIDFSSGDSYNWANITIDNVTIYEPRLFKDINYTMALLTANNAAWEDKKTELINDLRDNLDSGLRAELIGICNATGAGLQWENPEATKTEIRSLIDGKTFSFSINALEIQCIMEAILTLHTFENPITTTQQVVVENIEDATNGQYIIIEGSEGISPKTGKVTPQKIVCNEGLQNVRIYFSNTYSV